MNNERSEFTDDELKQLKDYYENHVGRDKIVRLIARLEAAERVCEMAIKDPRISDGVTYAAEGINLVDAWRKMAGK